MKALDYLIEVAENPEENDERVMMACKVILEYGDVCTQKARAEIVLNNRMLNPKRPVNDLQFAHILMEYGLG